MDLDAEGPGRSSGACTSVEPVLTLAAGGRQSPEPRQARGCWLPVPRGFCLTTAAYELAPPPGLCPLAVGLDAAGAGAAAPAPGTLGTVAGQARRLIEEAPSEVDAAPEIVQGTGRNRSGGERQVLSRGRGPDRHRNGSAQFLVRFPDRGVHLGRDRRFLDQPPGLSGNGARVPGAGAAVPAPAASRSTARAPSPGGAASS